MLGATTNGGLKSLDIWEGFNANMAVLGIPGSGKSFFLKTILSRLAICEEQLRLSVIDIEGEYGRLSDVLSASQVILNADTLQINPFDLSVPSFPQKSNFQEKIAALVGFFALLFGEQGVLMQRESALLHMALVETYTQVGITSDPETHHRPAPSVDDFAGVLRRNPQTEDFAHRVVPYLHLFPKRTQIETAQAITVYNLKALPEALMPIGMYLVTEMLWTALQQEGRDENGEITTRHIITIDEAWVLSKFAYGGILLNDFARRIRKYGGGLWVGTQQIGDLLATTQGKDLLALCHRKVLFRQDASSIDVVQRTLRLSATQMNFLQTAKCGEALYVSSKEAYIIEVLASEKECDVARTAQQAKGESSL